MESRKVAVVTGASSGFGQLTAGLLAENGFRVFGTSRKPAGGSPGVEMLELDVTTPESVERCVQQILTRCRRIDLLVNNAGQTHASLIEETPLEEARRIFETNFWGVVRMTHAVLPTMREQRAGLIVNVVSLAGLTGTPGMGFYSARKHALEGYTESLRVEIERFDIGVSLVEASFFRTNLHHAMSRETERIPNYDGLRTTIQSAVNEAIDKGDDPRKVADAIVAIALSGRPKLRYRVGTEAKWVPRMKAALPESWFLAALGRRFRLHRIEAPGRFGSP
jgi:NAD(P)-dependent dehydrogenase (short-subunit alcohol dehydrogenase family)